MLHKNCAKKISLICVIVRVLRSEMVPQQLQDRFTLRSRHNWQALEIGPRTFEDTAAISDECAAAQTAQRDARACYSAACSGGA
jgi:hypothetical protein